MPRAAAEQFISSYNERDWSGMRALLSDDCVYEQIGHPKRFAEGADEVVGIFRGWAETAPEARGTITGSVDGRDAVAIELDLEGPLDAPFGDFNPTRKRPVTRAALIFRLDAEGRVTRLRNYYDSLVLYQVLGIQD